MKKILLVTLLLITTSISITKAQCLAGSYTIGGTTPSYTTITSVVTTLTSNGVCGPVVFNIRPGTYTEQITISAITGTSSINTITFQSQTLDSTSVTVQGQVIQQIILFLELMELIILNFESLAINGYSLLVIN